MYQVNFYTCNVKERTFANPESMFTSLRFKMVHSQMHRVYAYRFDIKERTLTNVLQLLQIARADQFEGHSSRLHVCNLVCIRISVTKSSILYATT